MAGRKTKTIQFNLADTGRKFSGQSRSNVNLKAWIDLINSPHTQEMVNTGSILGYYGHQIRMLLGTHPPETAFIGGKQISISPAVRTIEIKADDQGNVTHRQEFLETAEGEFAMDKYKAKIGGFSAAHDYVTEGGMIMPVSYAGMDYVLQPNYINNIGDGALMDSIAGNDFVRSTLELSVLDMYDSIHQTNFARYQAEENLMRAIESENKLLEINAKTERRKQLIESKEAQLLDAALCPTVPIDEYLKDETRFLGDSVVANIEPKEKPKSEFYSPSGIFQWFA